MQIRIIGDNLEVTESIKVLVQEKIEKSLDKYLKTFANDMKISTLKIKSSGSRGFTVNFDMWLPGKEHIFAEEKGAELEHILISLAEKLKRQIKSYKSKLQDYKKKDRPELEDIILE